MGAGDDLLGSNQTLRMGPTALARLLQASSGSDETSRADAVAARNSAPPKVVVGQNHDRAIVEVLHLGNSAGGRMPADAPVVIVVATTWENDDVELETRALIMTMLRWEDGPLRLVVVRAISFRRFQMRGWVLVLVRTLQLLASATPT